MDDTRQGATLEVRGLTVARGGVPVLSGLSFALAPGEVMVLRGPNGSGKTTLLRTIAGLQPPVAGEVIAAPDAVAYAGHADGLKGTLSVTENLRFWGAGCLIPPARTCIVGWLTASSGRPG